MIIYFNKPLVFNGIGDIWIAENENKKLIIVNKTKFKGLSNQIIGKPIYKNKNNITYIFLEEDEENNDNICGIFVNKDYGYKCLNKENKIFEDFCEISNVVVFKFGIYKLGTLILEHNVKKTYGDFLWELTTNGWINKGLYTFDNVKKLITYRGSSYEE